MSELNEFREYVKEQQYLCYGVEGTTQGVHGKLSRQYDFLLETIDAYREINQPPLNENQKIVLSWLKKRYLQGYGATVIITIHLLQKLNNIDVLGDEPVTKAYRALNTGEEIDVINVFADWALEQEESV